MDEATLEKFNRAFGAFQQYLSARVELDEEGMPVAVPLQLGAPTLLRPIPTSTDVARSWNSAVGSLAHVQSEDKSAVPLANPSIAQNFFDVKFQGVANWWCILSNPRCPFHMVT